MLRIAFGLVGLLLFPCGGESRTASNPFDSGDPAIGPDVAGGAVAMAAMDGSAGGFRREGGEGGVGGRDGGDGRMMTGGHRDNSWKWFGYHELSEKEILDHLVHRQRYDRREPPPTNGGPVIVNVSVSLLDLSYSGGSGDDLYPTAVDALISQTWFDPRLIHGPSDGGGGGGGGGVLTGGATKARARDYLDGGFHGDSIWMPRAYWRSRGPRREGDREIRIFRNGTVDYAIRCQVELECSDRRRWTGDDGDVNQEKDYEAAGRGGLFATIPGPSAFCYFRIEGVGQPASSLFWRWQPGPSPFLGLGSDLRRRRKATATATAKTKAGREGERPVAALENVLTLDCSRKYPTRSGNHSCLEVRLSFFTSTSSSSSSSSLLSSSSPPSPTSLVFSTLLPDLTLAFLAYLAFWIETSSAAASARLIFSALVVFSFFTRASLQIVPNHELLVWRCVNLAFVTSACVQSVLAYSLVAHVGMKRLSNASQNSTSSANRGCRGPSRHREAVIGFHNNFRRHRIPDSSSSTGITGSGSLPHHLHNHHHHHAGIHHHNHGNCLSGAASTLMLREGLGAGCPKCTMACSNAAAAAASASASNTLSTGGGIIAGNGISSPFRSAVDAGVGGGAEFNNLAADAFVDDNGSITSAIFDRRPFRDDYSSSDASTKEAVAQTTVTSGSSLSTRRLVSRLDKLARFIYPTVYMLFVAGYFFVF